MSSGFSSLCKNIYKSRFFLTNHLVRRYSRKVSSNDNSYKPVKSRGNIQNEEDTNHLVWRDPSFELLTSNEFPLFLRGDIGLAWYDSQTTVKIQYELVMEQVLNNEDKVPNGDIVCSVQTCPTVLRKTVKELFPYRTLDDTSELCVITIGLKSDIKLMRINKELETEKLAQTFLIAAKNICNKLQNAGYWADFINPFSGRPYFIPTALRELYETDEKFRCLDFQIFEIKHCKVILSKQSSQKTFIGSLFTSAPLKKNRLNSIFTDK